MKKAEKEALEISKRLTQDTRPLLWLVTIGGLALAFFAVFRGYIGSLPWISSMVGLPWAAHGTICAFYLNMAKSDHKQGGITYEAAAANNFEPTNTKTRHSSNEEGQI